MEVLGLGGYSLISEEVISYINEHQMKSTGWLLENHVFPELKKEWKKDWKWGEGKRGKKILFPDYCFFQKLFFASEINCINMLYMEDTAAVMQPWEQDRRKYIPCYDIDLLRAEKQALHDPDSCASLQPTELTPGSWSNFYCHEGVVDSHLRVFIRLEYNIAWSIYWMYMGLYSHLVSSHNYYSHYPVISWGRGSQRTWQSDLAHAHTHTQMKILS